MSAYVLGESDHLPLDERFEPHRDDPSLNGQKMFALRRRFAAGKHDIDRLFLASYGLEYITEYFSTRRGLRVLTYPLKTSTSYEKAQCLGSWSPLNVIKALYLQSLSGDLYAIVVPETGCFLNKDAIREQLGLDTDDQLVKARSLPRNMAHGTCSPFLTAHDFIDNGGPVRAIVFDTQTLRCKREEGQLDDFSFGLDHRCSIQMSYAACFDMLAARYGDAVLDRELLGLSFKENLVRKNGKIRIQYEFDSLNYRTARFIEQIHGFGDVSIVNDYSDESYLPEVLTSNDFQRMNPYAYRAPG
jgi:hypothetical protein